MRNERICDSGFDDRCVAYTANITPYPSTTSFNGINHLHLEQTNSSMKKIFLFLVVLVMKGETGDLLKVKGLSVILLSKSKNKVLSVKDYGYDRKAFFDAINLYIK